MPSRAQVMVSGRVTDAKSHAPLYPATVYDTTSGSMTRVDSTGRYRIEARAGDRILYKYLGFHTREFIVPGRLEYLTHDVELVAKREKLKRVEIHGLTSYQKDSLQRAKAFAPYLSRRRAPVLKTKGDSSFFFNKNMKDDGTHSRDLEQFGWTFHPFSYFSKAERRKRKFHKRYVHNERNLFVDSRYRPEVVEKRTGLHRDSLQAFMVAHRPSYVFTRYASRLEFLSWIKRNARRWRDSIRLAQAKITQ